MHAGPTNSLSTSAKVKVSPAATMKGVTKVGTTNKVVGISNKVSGTNKVFAVSKVSGTNRVQAAAASVANPNDAAINGMMTKFQYAIRTNDFTYAVEVMYAPYLQKMGGRDRAMMVARSAPALMAAQRIRFISWTALRPYTYVVGKMHYYAIVRFEAVMEDAGRKTRLRSYLLGIRNANTSWQFVNGDDLTPGDFAQFFLDFPKNTPLPKADVIPL